MVPWAVFLAWALPSVLPAVLIALWAFQAWRRADYYSSPYKFWTRAFNEAPGKHINRIRYAEELMLELERRLKAGASYDSEECQFLIRKGIEIQDLICGKSYKLPENFDASI